MIILDTNVISEVFNPVPSPKVLDWLQQQADGEVFTTAITRGELLFGAHILPSGQRREALLAGLLRIFAARSPASVLPYDESAADAFAQITATRRAQGRPGNQSDMMIASIAHSSGAKLATRNVKDFVGCGIEVLDPWQA